MATMDEKRPSAPPETGQAPSDGTRAERRRRAHDVISTQRSYLDRLENELSEGLQLLSEELGRDFARNLAAQLSEGTAGVDLLPQIDELNRQIAAHHAELEQIRAAREQAQVEAGRLDHELRVREVLLREAQGQQEQRRAEMNALREQLADAQSQSVAAQERQEKFRRELADEREKASAAIEETKVQRRKLARDLKAQHADRSAEFEQRKAELKALETARNTQLERQLAASQEETEQARNALQELKSTLDQRTQELANSRGRIDSLDAEATTLRATLDKAQAHRARDAEEMSRAAAKDAAQQQELAAARAQVESLQGQVAELDRTCSEFKGRVAELDDALQQARGSLARDAEQLSRVQAGQTAQEVELVEARSKIGELEGEICNLRGALEQAQIAGAQGADDNSRAAAAESATREELNDARSHIAALEVQIAELDQDLHRAQTEAAHRADELSRAKAGDSADRESLTKLREERDAIAKKLAAAEAQSSKAGEGDARNASDLERRLQMAVDEMRELKRANTELENKLAKSRNAGPAAAPAHGTGLDWEAQKQRLLASLEADDPDDEEQVAERNTIENTIRLTDQIVAQKDEEISELKRQLAELPGKMNSKAAADGAIADVLDRDETIREERERLQQLQLEWREKIGKAETDLSVERAKIARERAEIADKMQAFAPGQEPRTLAGNTSDPSKPARGRWLSMLGLKEVDENPEKTDK
jgi:chromosome segregation ATPase